MSIFLSMLYYGKLSLVIPLAFRLKYSVHTVLQCDGGKKNNFVFSIYILWSPNNHYTLFIGKKHDF